MQCTAVYCIISIINEKGSRNPMLSGTPLLMKIHSWVGGWLKVERVVVQRTLASTIIPHFHNLSIRGQGALWAHPCTRYSFMPKPMQCIMWLGQHNFKQHKISMTFLSIDQHIPIYVSLDLRGLILTTQFS